MADRPKDEATGQRAILVLTGSLAQDGLQARHKQGFRIPTCGTGYTCNRARLTRDRGGAGSLPDHPVLVSCLDRSKTLPRQGRSEEGVPSGEP